MIIYPVLHLMKFIIKRGLYFNMRIVIFFFSPITHKRCILPLNFLCPSFKLWVPALFLFVFIVLFKYPLITLSYCYNILPMQNAWKESYDEGTKVYPVVLRKIHGLIWYSTHKSVCLQDNANNTSCRKIYCLYNLPFIAVPCC